jgi:uncharacterized protein YggE
MVVAVGLLAACGQRETLVAVHANATTRTSPDLAVVTLGVVARGSTARAAQAAQSERMSAINAAVSAAGVEETEVQTVGYGLEPVYAYPRGSAPRITGYQSRNTIAIRVRNLDALSGLVDAAVADGANELHGIQFSYQDEEASLDAARAQAVETARARAERYAEAAGMRVARLVSITEPGSILTPIDGSRGFMAPQAVSAEQNAIAISPGQLDNSSSVTVVFALQ